MADEGGGGEFNFMVDCGWGKIMVLPRQEFQCDFDVKLSLWPGSDLKKSGLPKICLLS